MEIWGEKMVIALSCRISGMVLSKNGVGQKEGSPGGIDLRCCGLTGSRACLVRVKRREDGSNAKLMIDAQEVGLKIYVCLSLGFASWPATRAAP